MEDIKAGTEVLVKRLRQGRFRSYGYEYTKAVVSRVTKARIFTKYAHQRADDATEREFNREDLTERRDIFNKAKLVVGPEAIHAAELEQAAERARRALEAAGRTAMDQLSARFANDRIDGRTDAEIQALLAAVEALFTASPSLAPAPKVAP